MNMVKSVSVNSSEYERPGFKREILVARNSKEPKMFVPDIQFDDEDDPNHDLSETIQSIKR